VARLRRDCIVQLTALLALAWPAPAIAQVARPIDIVLPPVPEFDLYDRPTLALDPGMHTAVIRRADVDAAGRYAVTGSYDKAVRVWSIQDGRLLRTIRLPAGPGNVGKVFAVAISPNGDLIAVGGWLGTEGIGTSIYLFDRATGELTERIEGLPETVTQLIFSPDGRNLAITLGGSQGLRLYDRDTGWAEVARDPDYGGLSYGADFSADGRLATTSYDGNVRLYDYSFHLVAEVEAIHGEWPVGIAFSPDGTKLAIGYDGSKAVELLDGHTLEPLSRLNTKGINNGDLGIVAWSADGQTLFAGGQYDRGDGISAVVAWADAGAGVRRELPAGNSTIMTLAPLSNGDLLVAAQDPYLAVFGPNGGARWAQTPKQADFSSQDRTLAVSFDGQTVDFGYGPRPEASARFDVTTPSLQHDPPANDATTAPEHDGLWIRGWENTTYPTLDGAPLGLDPYEMSRSLAIHPKGDRFVLGTEWWLRAYDAQGELLWRQDVPGVVCAVNISGDGRLVVAAYADGTIRWHRMDDGKELLAFFPLADRTNWVAWTPDGFYAATPGAHSILRWHLNHGWDAPGEAIPVSDIAELRRPEVLPLVLQEMDIVQALGLAELNEARLATQRRLNSAIKPGTQLHVLAVGVGDYNEDRRLQ
jgi:WD40 repeat protein